MKVYGDRVEEGAGPAPPPQGCCCCRPLTKEEKCGISIFLFLIFFLLADAAFVIVAIKQAHYSHAPEITIESLSISNYNYTPATDGSLINVTLDGRFKFHNVKKKSPSTSFHDVVFVGFYEGEFFGRVTVPPFIVNQGVNDTTVEAKLWLADFYIDGWKLDRIVAEPWVKFDFEIAARWRRSPHFSGSNKAKCKGVALSSSTRELLDGPKRCKWDDAYWRS